MERVDVTTARRFDRGWVRCAATVVGVASLLAACSGSEAAGPLPEPPATAPAQTDPAAEHETTTTSTTTTSTTTTTTLPQPVVETVPPTDDSTPAPDTTDAADQPVPTNTMFDPATPEGEVEQATLSNLIAFSECLEQLPNCDPQTATRFALLEYAAGNVGLIEGWNADGLEVRNNDTWVYIVERVEFNDDATEALSFTCEYDGSSLIKPATESSPEQVIVVLDESSRSRYLVRKINGSWVVTARDSVESVPGNVAGFCER